MKTYHQRGILPTIIGGILCLIHLALPVAAQQTSRLTLEQSTDLASWQAVPVTPGMIDANGKLLVTSSTPQTFYRLQVEVLSAPDGFSLIPCGNFQMGDNFAEGSIITETPVHAVNVSAYYIGKYEVTKALWDSVRTWGASNGYTDLPTGAGKGATHPVHTLNWDSMVKWCNARSQQDNLTPCYTVSGSVYKTGSSNAVVCNWNANGYRLPTEAEWEKAARGGLSGKRFPSGDTISHSLANYYADGTSYGNQSGDVGYHPSYTGGGAPYSSPVGSFAPNGYGLYDTEGNLYELVWDWYAGDYYASSPSADPRGPSTGSLRVLRGGYWAGYAYDCRVAGRLNRHPSFTYDNVSFRVARSSIP